ncbi:dodecin domain-containing protein [Pacificimonas sp. WHA3]|uniref:Dodecin domain-containing protein n=1 Tax=Pacificimonas pallii TaxID=2827236 RepID=A0ABS6SIX7_9SPHN|nr:dodecin family protein [Pacificimonas pallii]MBV7257906.1 dodecin domain-containing protein [Pacificimonas pallii]
MSVARVTEIIASSTKGIEDAVEQGIAKASETIQGIQGVWVKDTKAVVENNKVSEWRVTLMVTFIVK